MFSGMPLEVHSTRCRLPGKVYKEPEENIGDFIRMWIEEHSDFLMLEFGSGHILSQKELVLKPPLAGETHQSVLLGQTVTLLLFPHKTLYPDTPKSFFSKMISQLS